MRYFVPDIRLASELPRQRHLQEKLGGLPWGLPNRRWPMCTVCGRSQSLLAQFIHHPGRLDLSRDGRVLFVFQCNHDPGACTTWEGGSGANACLVLEPEDLVDALAANPSDRPKTEREARIVTWLERDDGISEADESAFYSDSEYLKLPDELAARAVGVTRLGSVPTWIQSADEGPKDGFRFVGQLDSFYSFFVPPLSPNEEVYSTENRLAGRTHICQGPDFGDTGIGYIFLRTTSSSPEGWFFWQCG